MNPKKSIIIVIAIAVVLFFVGIYTCGKVIVWLLPGGNVKYVSYSLSSLSQTLIYSLVFGLLPVCALLVWKIGAISSSSKRFISVLLILASIVVFTFLRRFWIITEINKFSSREQQFYFPFNQVQFELYMLLGLMVGCILALFLFRKQTS